MAETDDQVFRKGTVDNIDPFAYAPPGHALTDDNTRWPWGQPPQDVDPDVVLDNAINALKKPKVRQELIKLLAVGVSVEVLVEGFLFQSFQDGKFTPDVGLLIKPALAIYMADMAEEEKIPYRLFENDNAMEEDEMDDVTFFQMMRQNNPRMFEYVRENINSQIRAGSVPQQPKDENFLTMKDKG